MHPGEHNPQDETAPPVIQDEPGGLGTSAEGDLPASEVAVEPDEAEPPSFVRWLLEIAVLFALAWVIAWAVRTWVVQPFVIPSASMEDTLQIGDYVLANKFVYRFQAPRPGDIVVFESPEGDPRDYIKRVVAVGGQTVDVSDGVVYVDGKRRDEPFVNRTFPDHYSSDSTVTVPAGTVFVMGDNRANSRDSRFFGPQPVTHIVGKAFVIYWPLGRLGTL